MNNTFKTWLIVYVVLSLSIAGFYFLWMVINQNNSLSTDSADWSAFGAYFGGILAPAVTLLTGFFIYKSYEADAHVNRIAIVRDSIKRNDDLFEKSLYANIRNSQLPEKYYGKTFFDIILDVSITKEPVSEYFRKVLLTRIETIAIIGGSVCYYYKLLEGSASDDSDSERIALAESSYWITKYSPVIEKMIQIAGINSVRSYLKPQYKADLATAFRVKV